jgi:N-acyl-D-aspartate/D-glutamate deacylase
MELLLRGATVVDGTGRPGERADVRVEGGRIAAVGTDAGPAGGATTVDLDGLVLAPGFIDPHTHYDAQVLWDPDVTPSSWHGVTTVVMGNCGFGLAPCRPEGRDVIMRTLENVEGMPLPALEAGIPWDFESFPEYLDVLDQRPFRVNATVLCGHTPLRLFVMGDEATERAATPDELAQMRALLVEALRAGAAGFSTTRSQSHVGAYGRPVPSRAATLEEVWTLAGTLGEVGHGTVEAAWGPDLYVDEFPRLAADIGRPVTWAAIMTKAADPGYAAEIVARAEANGGQVYPQVACRPIVVQIQLSDPFPFANVPAFGEILTLSHADRAARYASAEWRAGARDGIRRAWGPMLDGAVVEESRAHAELVDGPPLGKLAADRGVDSLDVMADLALAEDLDTRFRVTMTNDAEAQIGELLAHPRLLLGLSDAGAHTSQLCDANYGTYLLSRYVRELGAIPLETGVWRLTGQPAAVYGLTGRGVIAPGHWADLVAFDPATIGTTRAQRIHDFPGGADRLVARGTGIHHVWVAGEAVRSHGADRDGVRPGRLLRAGRG